MDARYNAIRFVQNDRVFYTAAIPAGDLIAKSKVDVWDSDDPEDERGYQRALQRNRARAVAEYISKEDAIMPLGGLMNSRAADGEAWGTQLHFEPHPGQRGIIETGTLVIPADAAPLWTVDMQHRLAGFEYAIEELDRHELRHFPLVVTIADGLSKMEEIEQFELINTTQKKVATDLARQLLATQYQVDGVAGLPDTRREWEAKGALIANALNESGGVFMGRIIPPNKSARQVPHGITKQTTFVSSLKPVLTSPYFQRLPMDRVTQLLDEYWLAVADVWPSAISSPRDSIIFKGPGVYPLHMMMPEVIETVRDRGLTPSKESMADVIVDWVALGEEYWDKDNTETGATKYGSSGQGHSRTAAELRTYLPQPPSEAFE